MSLKIGRYVAKCGMNIRSFWWAQIIIEAALKVTRGNIIQADIWAKVIFGDIGRPDLLAEDLRENYGIELKDLLNVRTFLDHNRIWSEPTEKRLIAAAILLAHLPFAGDASLMPT